MAITAALVKELRERTGAGMLDCKKALMENNGDIEKSIDWLREKGIAKAAKKSGRAAAQGLVFGEVSDDRKRGLILEFNSETDFVAKNEEFINFGQKLARVALEENIGSVDELHAYIHEGKSIEDTITALIAKIGENMNLRRIELVETSGFLETYIHLGGKIGVLLELDGEANDENIQKAKDIAMHIAAMDPGYLSPEQVTTDDLDREREIARKQLLEEGKPADIVEKILEGKMRKFYEESTLLKQRFVKDDKYSVEEYAKPMIIKGFERYKVGEGVEVEESDFAAEVAAQLSGN